jgi:hypothetical protein
VVRGHRRKVCSSAMGLVLCDLPLLKQSPTLPDGDLQLQASLNQTIYFSASEFGVMN